MSFLRRDKLDRPKKAVEGKHNIPKDKEPNVVDPDPRESLPFDEVYEAADTLSTILTVENTEIEINRLKLRAQAALANLNVKVTHPSVVGALTTLNDGVPTNELNAELLQRAIDLHLDSFVHTQGFDPVPVILRCYEDPEEIENNPMPKAPLPYPLQNAPFNDPTDIDKILPLTCSEMQTLDNIPEPTVYDEETGETVDNPQYMEAPLTDVIDKVKKFTLLDLLVKLAALFVYFIAKFIRDMVYRYRNKRFIKGLIRSIIRKMERAMRKAWCKITEECTEEDLIEAEMIDQIIPDDIQWQEAIDESSFENRGLACVEAASQAMKYINENLNDNDAIYALLKAEEMAQYHEAQKHGLLMAITDDEKYDQKVKELNNSTMSSPRFRKRYGICREQFKERLKKAGILS